MPYNTSKWINLALMIFLIPVSATCSGSGLTWSCTAGSTAGQINAAISSASDGATVTLDNGTYSATGIDLAGGAADSTPPAPTTGVFISKAEQ